MQHPHCSTCQVTNGTYNIIDLQDTANSLGRQLNGAGRHKQRLQNVLFQNISDGALKLTTLQTINRGNEQIKPNNFEKLERKTSNVNEE